MRNSTGLYPCVQADAAGSGVVSQAGGISLVATVRASGLDRALRAGFGPWRTPMVVHEPAKVLLDLAVTLALGGDWLADVAVLRAEPGGYGQLASDPTVSRTLAALAREATAAPALINSACAARARVWELAGEHAPDHDVTADRPLVIDVDGRLVSAHSDTQDARPTFKRGYGHHPLWVFADHGSDGTGEPLAVLLRPGNAGSNTAADHITVLQQALPPAPRPPGRHPPRSRGARADRPSRRHARAAGLDGRAALVRLGRVRAPGEHPGPAGADP